MVNEHKPSTGESDQIIDAVPMQQRRGRFSKFFRNNFLMFSLILAVFLALIGSGVFYVALSGITDERKVQLTFYAFSAIAISVILFTWPRWIWRKVDELVSKAVATLGDVGSEPEKNFNEAMEVVFDGNVAASIYEYERYLKNEYILDMKKHHFSWLLLAISGLLTVLAAFLVIMPGVGFLGSEAQDADVNWVTAAATALPALITGVLLKMWLETRENLKRTRQRTDKIYRQKIRILFLASRLKDKADKSLEQAIEENTMLLQYVQLETEKSELAD